MHKSFHFILKLLVVAGLIAAQTAIFAQNAYFQQRCDYTIGVALDDQKHTLTGQIDIVYTNNAPEALSEIRMHLWGNAFKNRNTAFCRQKLRHGSMSYYFAADSTEGYYRNLDFAVNGEKVTWKYDKKNPDIATLILKTPLGPGQKITISTPFILKIPYTFSRLGHTRQSYQMTQWFPKPAVYDAKGWHDMPFLDVGEFYADYGNYDVTLTLPANYVVGATGVLQTPSEIAFLEQKVADFAAGKIGDDYSNIQFPPSAAQTKTIRYIAENVPDFAWFADKRFLVAKDVAVLASGKKVDCYGYFTKNALSSWKNSAAFVRRAVEFYSEKVGPYPWPHASAVYAALGAGGGMEYPMITVIGNTNSAKSLDDIICHEVGHNWFQGILGSNEREHAWLDEGINSYYEARYMLQYYQENTAEGFLPKRLKSKIDLHNPAEIAWAMLENDGRDLAVDTHSDKVSPVQYGILSYYKTAYCMALLEQSSGTSAFDQAMQAYFKKWQFKHPSPEDFYGVLHEKGLEMNWFKDIIETRKTTDYAIKSVKKTENGYKLRIKNRGKLAAPLAISTVNGGNTESETWYPGFTGKKEITVTSPTAEAFIIDPNHAGFETNRRNNIRRTTGMLPGIEPMDISILAPFRNNKRSQIGITPWLGVNAYDRFMLGAAIYNPPFPQTRFQYLVAPGYGFGSGDIVGLADFRYRILPKNFLNKITIALTGKTFNINHNQRDEYDTRFYRISPWVRFDFHQANSAKRQSLRLRYLHIGVEEPVYAVDTLTNTSTFTGETYKKSNIYEIKYALGNRTAPNPYQLTITLEHQAYKDALDNPASYVKSALEWKQDIYYKHNKSIGIRIFGGYFLKNTQRNRGSVSSDFARGSWALNPQGFNDYKFDDVYIARTATEGFLSQQVSQTDGGFKNAFGSPFASYSNSNNYILALNLTADLPNKLPFNLPLKPWFDIGYFDDATPTGVDRPLNEQLLWSFGAKLSLLKGGLNFYFPLANSKALKDRYCERSSGSNPNALFCGGNYFTWISWSIKFSQSSPFDVIESLYK